MAPTPLAAALLKLGRDHPDRLAVLVDELEELANPQRDNVGATAPAPPAPVSPSDPSPAEAPRRLRNLSLTPRQYAEFMNNSAVSWVQALPQTFKVVDGPAVTRSLANARYTLTLESPAFSPVAPGEAVPTWQPESFHSWK
ncbi:MAG TPA: hypothetical protein VFB06_37700 [Streptosporangiaceae bacterium]|nr:hypothetical protein [Streptosporangiaceae bacterium]